VDLDGLLGRAQLVAHLLVEAAGRDQGEDLPLARREARQARLQDLLLAAGGEPLAAAVQGPLHRLQQVGVGDRLLQEIDGPALHGAHAARHVGVTADEEEREVQAAPGQLVLEVQAGEPRHAQVRHHAGRLVRGDGHQQVGGGREAHHLQAARAEDAGQGAAHPRVVVHEEHAAAAGGGRAPVQLPHAPDHRTIVVPRESPGAVFIVLTGQRLLRVWRTPAGQSMGPWSHSAGGFDAAPAR
jgi:hypothetical protein